MRRIVVSEFVTMDGVMEDPGVLILIYHPAPKP